MRRKISTGSVFQKAYRDRAGRTRKTSTWYLKYYVKGKPVESSSGTDDYDEALAMLRKRMADQVIQADHADHADHPERVRMDQLFDLLVEDHRYKERKSTYDTELRVDTHLRPFFGERKAQAISTSALREYVAHRRRQKAEAATINKELSWVRRALKIGAKHEPPLVLRVPYFEMLNVDNVREGTIEHEQYRIVRDALPPYARVALVIAYHTGARKGEIRSIQRDRIDLKAKRIYLPGRTTKNGKPRYLPIYGDMEAELDMAIAGGHSTCPLLVQHKGQAVFDFEKAWATACDLAGVPHALFHDLRRTALTNMIEAGLSEKEAMEISGHKTRAVFDRYHIVSERRMRQNAEKLGAHLKSKEAAAVQNTVPNAAVQDNGARQKNSIN
jgi:integrase